MTIVDVIYFARRAIPLVSLYIGIMSTFIYYIYIQ
jgi:hypothetical protein